jgi:hypothetical protein
VRKPDIRPLKVTDLIVDSDVQRDLDQRRVAKIADDLNLEALGVITVSHRENGSYHIVDGQHRVAALKQAGGDGDKVMCRVFDGLTVQEEAELFRLLNNTAKPLAVDLFRVRVVEGDPAAVDLAHILNDHGWRIGSSTSTTIFAAVVALERVYRLEPAAAEKSVASLTRAWGHDPAAVDGRLVEGLGLVYVRYGTTVEVAEMVDRLAKSGTPSRLIGKARDLRDLIGGTVTKALAEIVVELYNARRKTKALPPWRSA